MNEHSTPCEICGTATTSHATKRCDHCWEVEHRLEAYLKNPKGQEFARSKMPLLNDWVDGTPDAWDYEAVLIENDAKVVWNDVVNSLSIIWWHGCMFIAKPAPSPQ